MQNAKVKMAEKAFPFPVLRFAFCILTLLCLLRDRPDLKEIFAGREDTER